MTAQEPVERFARLSDAATALRRVLEQYKAPDNAAQQLIRATVGADLQARLKELASTPRVEAPVRQPPSTSLQATSNNAPGTASSTPSTSSPSFCGSCGTPAHGRDRFCRVCGSSVTPSGMQTPAASTPAPQGTPATVAQTAVMPRVDVMGPTSVRTGAVRKDDSSPGSSTGSSTGPAVNNPFLSPSKAPLPINLGATPLGTPSSMVLPTVELAVVSGLVEMLRNGQVVAADEDARKAAFAVVDDFSVSVSTDPTTAP
jgi:hypothetical protein